MADKKISQLTPLEKPTGNEEFPVAIEGQNYKVKIKDVKPDLSDYVTSKQAAQKYYPKVDGESLSDLVDTLNEGLGYVEQDLQENYARKDGAYEGMLVGSAMNLQGQDVVANGSAYRTSGGSDDIASGLAEVMSIKGNAIAWNQLAKLITSSNFIAYNSNNVVINIVDGVCTVTVNNSDGSGYSVGVKFKDYLPLIQGHVYLARYDVYSSFAYEYKIEINNYAQTTSYIPANKWTKLYALVVANRDTSQLLVSPYGVNFMEEANTYSVKNPILFDLTLIYGQGNEPTTAEQFEADYQRWFGKPLEYEEYDEGSIRSVKATGIKTVGFNLWEHGDLSLKETGWASGIKEKWYNEVGYKGQIYVQADLSCNSEDVWLRFIIHYTDGSSDISPQKGTNYVASLKSNPQKVVSYISFSNSIKDTTAKISNICINFSWSGKRDGEYEPHWEETKPIPIIDLMGKLNGEGESVTIFPDGLKRAGSVYDEILIENGVTKAIKRVGSVDLGSLNWMYSNEFLVFRAGDIKYQVKEKFTWLNAKYPFVGSYSNTTDKECGYIYYTEFAIKDSSFGEDANMLKNSLQGVIAYYELAEPEVYILDNFELPLNYKVDDFGTEQILMPEDSVAPTLMTRYGVNAVDTLRRLPTQYISADSMDNFLAQLGVAMGGTWTKTWDEQTGSYAFRFTPTETAEMPDSIDEQELTN